MFAGCVVLSWCSEGERRWKGRVKSESWGERENRCGDEGTLQWCKEGRSKKEVEVRKIRTEDCTKRKMEHCERVRRVPRTRKMEK